MKKLSKTLLAFFFFQRILIAGPCDYQADWTNKFQEKLLIRDWACQKDLFEQGCPSDYLNSNFAPFLPEENISTILEVGSRDAIDGICLSERFKAHVFSFECSPEAIEICQFNIGDNPNVTLVPLAVWNSNQTISFYPIIAAGTDPLIGLSSALPLNPEGPTPETQVQREIQVEAVRLDQWLDQNEVQKVDLMCVDVQGGTLQVLQGLGQKLNDISYIIAEVEYQPYYVDQALYSDVEKYLQDFGFRPVAQMFHGGIYKDVADTLFVKHELIPDWAYSKKLPIVGSY